MNASLDATVDGAGNGERMPIRRSRATCWALTLCDHAAIPPISPMNSRRRIDHLAGGKSATYQFSVLIALRMLHRDAPMLARAASATSAAASRRTTCPEIGRAHV